MKESKKFYTMQILDFEKFKEKKQQWVSELYKVKDYGVIDLKVEFIPNEPNELNLSEEFFHFKEMIRFTSKSFTKRVEIVNNSFKRIVEQIRAKHLELETGVKKNE
jgi:hypothetical protein